MNTGINSRSFWKLNKLNEIIYDLNKLGISVPFVAIVESWLKPHISDAQIHIENYHVFRADRKISKNGGALLYVSDTIPVDESVSYDDNICHCVICLSKTYHCLIISIYRPPTASKESFANLLSFINTFIYKHNKNNNHKTFIFGDFNFPGVSWENCANLSCPTSSQSFSLFSTFMEKKLSHTICYRKH